MASSNSAATISDDAPTNPQNAASVMVLELTGHRLRFHLVWGPVMDPVVSRLQEAITVTPVDIVHQRRVAAVTHAVAGGNVSETARIFGVSRKTIHQWKRLAETAR